MPDYILFITVIVILPIGLAVLSLRIPNKDKPTFLFISKQNYSGPAAKLYSFCNLFIVYGKIQN